MLLFVDDAESLLFVNFSSGVKIALGPERELLIARLARESDATSSSL